MTISLARFPIFLMNDEFAERKEHAIGIADEYCFSFFPQIAPEAGDCLPALIICIVCRNNVVLASLGRREFGFLSKRLSNASGGSQKLPPGRSQISR